jgi:triacylglycerol esterase/lipase EstA (alpha/beta hydrolase family)
MRLALAMPHAHWSNHQRVLAAASTGMHLELQLIHSRVWMANAVTAAAASNLLRLPATISLYQYFVANATAVQASGWSSQH